MEILENFILQWANLAILAVGLIIVLRQPAREFLKGRKQKFLLSLEKANRDLEEVKTKYDEAKKKEAQAGKDAEDLKRSMMETGKFSRKKIIEDATNTADRIKKESKLLASQELQSAKDALTRELLSNAFSKAQETLKSGISKDNHKILLEESFNALRQADISQYENTLTTT